VDLDASEIDTTMSCHSRDPFAHGRQCVLRKIHQDRPRLWRGVLTQARRAGGYTQGQIQTEPRFRAFGGATDHANRRGSPQLFHEPVLSVVVALDLAHTHDVKWLKISIPSGLIYTHRQFHALTFFRNAERG
jgi:hypothetical protein